MIINSIIKLNCIIAADAKKNKNSISVGLTPNISPKSASLTLKGKFVTCNLFTPTGTSVGVGWIRHADGGSPVGIALVGSIGLMGATVEGIGPCGSSCAMLIFDLWELLIKLITKRRLISH